MPRIQSIDSSVESQNEVMSVIGELVKDAPKFNSISEALTHQGAGIKEIAYTVADVMNNSQRGSTRLAGAKLAAELHGIARGKEESKIVFVVQSEAGINLQNIFNPTR